MERGREVSYPGTQSGSYTQYNELTSEIRKGTANNSSQESGDKTPKKDQQVNKRFRCQFKECEKTFSKSDHLKTHIRTHTGERPYKCVTCHRGFSDLANLKRHNRIHTGDKPFKCDFCSKTFAVSSNLKQHKRTHTGDRPYICSFCKKSFSHVSSRRKHLMQHEQDRNSNLNTTDSVLDSVLDNSVELADQEKKTFGHETSSIFPDKSESDGMFILPERSGNCLTSPHLSGKGASSPCHQNRDEFPTGYSMSACMHTVSSPPYVTPTTIYKYNSPTPYTKSGGYPTDPLVPVASCSTGPQQPAEYSRSYECFSGTSPPPFQSDGANSYPRQMPGGSKFSRLVPDSRDPHFVVPISVRETFSHKSNVTNTMNHDEPFIRAKEAHADDFGVETCSFGEPPLPDVKLSATHEALASDLHNQGGRMRPYLIDPELKNDWSFSTFLRYQ